MFALIGVAVLARNDAGQQFCRSICSRAPDDVPAGWAIPFVADFLEPGMQECVPLLVSPDAKRFQIPAVLAVMAGRQFCPKPSRFACSVMAQRYRTLAAHSGGRIIDQRLDATDRL